MWVSFVVNNFSYLAIHLGELSTALNGMPLCTEWKNFEEYNVWMVHLWVRTCFEFWAIWWCHVCTMSCFRPKMMRMLKSIIINDVIIKTMICYIRGKFLKNFKWLSQRLLLYCDSNLELHLWKSLPLQNGIWTYSFANYVHCDMCSSSNTQILELADKIDKLEVIVFGENPCQNCTVELWVKYLELVFMKTLGQNLSCQTVNWPNNFAFSFASAVTNFGFNVAVAVFRIWYKNKVNRKFKIWEESEELKYLRKLERMQFPPTADYEMGMLPERW